MMSYDIVAVGAVSRDVNVVMGKEEIRYGGGSYCAAFAAHAAGCTTAVVTKLTHDDAASLDLFQEAGIPVFSTTSAHTTSIKNVYTTPDLDRRTCSMLAMADPFGIEDFPPELEAKIFQIAALIAGEVPLDVLIFLAQKGRVGVDAQGFIRTAAGHDLVLTDWQDKYEAFPYIDFLKTDAAEAEILTGKSDRYEAICILAEMGSKEILLTHSSEAIVYAEGQISRAPFKPKNLSGRTGRGDTCFAAYLSQRLHNYSPEESLKFAAALTSLKMEVPGPFRGSLEDVHALLATY